jgi:transketolase
VNDAAPALEKRSIDTIRTLAIDAVEAAGCGHPGTPMALAPLAYVLFRRVMKHCPTDPRWPDRDRFVLSAGHASMLLYASLHLTGYDLSLDDLKAFRQWGSKTPGHPEAGHTPGVETTTGPLGQGFGNAVGMALAERMLAARFNRPGHEVVDHRTWVIASDGDLMEGVASEAASLAGHLGLARLCVFYDDNRITIDGSTSLAFTEDVGRRFEAYGWNVLRVPDGAGTDELERAARAAEAETERPTLVIVRTHIGFGAPTKQDTAKAHGEALGAEEARLAKRAYGWPEDARFLVPDDVAAHLREAVARGEAARDAWARRRTAYATAHPAEARALDDALAGRLPPAWERQIPRFPAGGKPTATRKASATTLQALAQAVPSLVGGSADLAGSVGTSLPGGGDVARGAYAGRTIHFGVREHAMGAVLNGLALHGGFRPFGGTFLVFSDYMRPSIRLAALMGLRVVYVFTHDSVGLGEDGPTHQPIEHLASLRAIPGLEVMRPADAGEAAEAWRVALRADGPVALVLTRQDVPVLDRSTLGDAAGVSRGGYVLLDSPGTPDVVIAATGSEVSLALEAASRLGAEGLRARVVSLPSLSRFEAQDADYRESVLPTDVPRVTVEAASTFGWERIAGPGGRCLGIDRFGASAPGARVLRELGLTPDAVASAAREVARRWASVPSPTVARRRGAARRPRADDAAGR